MKRGTDPRSWDRLFASADDLPAFPAGLAAGSPRGVERGDDLRAGGIVMSNEPKVTLGSRFGRREVVVMTVLVVTGSRSLASIPGAREWCRDHVTHALRTLPRPSLVVAGDADGPDTWALEHAFETGHHTEWWRLTGLVHSSQRGISRWGTRGNTPSVSWPLVRNAAMVADVMARYPQAIVLAFVDPKSKTHGTGHTIGLAKRAGLRVERKVWSDSIASRDGAGGRV